MSNVVPLGAPEPTPPPDLFEVDPPVDIDAEVSRIVADYSDLDESSAIEASMHEHVEGRWRITDEDAADWAMTQLAAAAGTLGTLTARRDAYIRRANRWFKHVAAEADRTVRFMHAHLEDYGLRVREGSPRTKAGEPSVKTVRLVAGEVATRGGGKPRVEIVAKDRLVEWAREHLPDAVTTTYDVKVTDLRDHVTVTEVEVDGETVYTVQARHDASIDVPFVEAVVPPVTAAVRPQPIEE